MQIVGKHESHMDYRRDWRWALRLLTCVFAAVVGALSAATAEASCGDYLFRPMHPHHSIRDGHNDPVQPMNHADHVPSCRQSTDDTPIVPPIVTLENSERWGAIANVDIQGTDPASYLARCSEQLVLPQFTTRLERPPKSNTNR
jgi:hypothetical protein